ncbi:MAG: FAD:protein FMN transferase [Verrucomicrobiales bacterium]
MKIRLLATLALGILSACGEKKPANEPAVEKIHESRPLMGTLFQITCYSAEPDQARRALHAAFALAAGIEEVASDYQADSELNRLCRAPHGQAHPLSPTLYQLLDHALQTARLTQGAYDPTLGPLTRLWRESRKNRALPEPPVLAQAQARCGFRHLQLDPETRSATLALPGMQLDLGGIAKGFAADAMLASLQKAGFPQSMIAAGGDLRLGDPPPGRPGWNVGLRTTRLELDEVITLSNCAISTSGDLHQSVTIDGTRYAHLIDPATGLGLTTQRAASVIAPSATLTDPLATAACLLPDAPAFFEAREELSLRLLIPDAPPRLTGLFRENVARTTRP